MRVKRKRRAKGTVGTPMVRGKKGCQHKWTSWKSFNSVFNKQYEHRSCKLCDELQTRKVSVDRRST